MYKILFPQVNILSARCPLIWSLHSFIVPSCKKILSFFLAAHKASKNDYRITLDCRMYPFGKKIICEGTSIYFLPARMAKGSFRERLVVLQYLMPRSMIFSVTRTNTAYLNYCIKMRKLNIDISFM